MARKRSSIDLRYKISATAKMIYDKDDLRLTPQAADDIYTYTSVLDRSRTKFQIN